MAEYVFDFDRFEECDLDTGLREAVTRCRDCKYGKAISEVGCILLESRGGSLKDPEGFCKWGERL